MPTGEEYLRSVYEKLIQGSRFPIGPSLADLHAKQEAAGIREYYEFTHLERACMYLTNLPYYPDPEDGIYCKHVHDPSCRDCQSCHFCRQCTITRKATCATCGSQWCKKCLNTRMGEARDEIGPGRRFPDWHCPRCRDICNCSALNCSRRRRGLDASGQMHHEARSYGYPSAAVYLILPFMATNSIGRQQLEDSLRRIHAQEVLVPHLMPDAPGRVQLQRQPAASERPADSLHNRPGGQAAPTRRVPLLQRVRDELPLPPAEHIRNRLLALGFMSEESDMQEDTGRPEVDSLAALLSPTSSPAPALRPWWQKATQTARQGGAAANVTASVNVHTQLPVAQLHINAVQGQVAQQAMAAVTPQPAAVHRQGAVQGIAVHASTPNTGAARSNAVAGSDGTARAAAAVQEPADMQVEATSWEFLRHPFYATGPQLAAVPKRVRRTEHTSPPNAFLSDLPGSRTDASVPGASNAYKRARTTEPVVVHPARRSFEHAYRQRVSDHGGLLAGQTSNGRSLQTSPHTLPRDNRVADNSGDADIHADMNQNSSYTPGQSPDDVNGRQIHSHQTSPDSGLAQHVHHTVVIDLTTAANPAEASNAAIAMLVETPASPVRHTAGSDPAQQATPAICRPPVGASWDDDEQDAQADTVPVHPTGGFFLGLLYVANKIAKCSQQKQQMMELEQRLHIPLDTISQQYVSRAVMACVLDQLHSLQLQLPGALCVVDHPSAEKAPGWEFLRNCDDLKQASALFLFLVEQLQDPHQVNAAVLLAFNLVPFIDFAGCDPGSRAVLAHTSITLIKKLTQRGLPNKEPLSQLTAWLSCLTTEHISHLHLVDNPLVPQQAIHLGFMTLPPAVDNSDAVSSAPCASLSKALRGDITLADPRMSTVQTITSSVTELLNRLLCNCQDLCSSLGGVSVDLLPGLTPLLDPRNSIHPDLRHAALVMLACIINDACPRPTMHALSCTDAQLVQGQKLADELLSNALQPLELLVSCTYKLRKRPEQFRNVQIPMSQLHAGVFESLPSQEVLQELDTAAMQRPAVAERRRKTMAKLAGLPRRVLGMVYASLLWAGRLSWAGLCQMLVLPGLASNGALYLQKEASVRKFAIAVMAQVVSQLAMLPQMHPSIVSAVNGGAGIPVASHQQVQPGVMRMWMISLMEQRCRREAAELTAALLATPLVHRLISAAVAAIEANKQLMMLVGPLPQQNNQPAEEQDQAVASDEQAMRETTLESQLFMLFEPKDITEDVFGYRRSQALAVILIGLHQLGLEAVDMLTTVDKMWNLGYQQECSTPTSSIIWRCSILTITLRLASIASALTPAPGSPAMHAASPAAPRGPGSCMSMAMLHNMLHRCCKAIQENAAHLWGSTGNPGEAMNNSLSQEQQFASMHACVLQHLQPLAALLPVSMSTGNSSRQHTPGIESFISGMYYRVFSMVVFIPSLQLLNHPPNSLQPSPGAKQQTMPELQRECQGAITKALISPINPPNPAIALGGQPHSTNGSWQALQWLVQRPVTDMVVAAITSRARVMKLELEACAALRMLRQLFTEESMQTMQALSWILPPIMLMTKAALEAPDFASLVTVQQLYELWADLLPVLHQHELLKPLTQAATVAGIAGWSQGPASSQQLTAAVQYTLQLLCSHTYVSVGHVRGLTEATAASALAGVPPNCWNAAQTRVACAQLIRLLGFPRSVTPEETVLLEQALQPLQAASKTNLMPAATASSSVSSISMGSVPPGDRHIRLFDTQLLFLGRLLQCSQAEQPEWEPVIIPSLVALARGRHGTPLSSLTNELLSVLVAPKPEPESQQRPPAVDTSVQPHGHQLTAGRLDRPQQGVNQPLVKQEVASQHQLDVAGQNHARTPVTSPVTASNGPVLLTLPQVAQKEVGWHGHVIAVLYSMISSDSSHTSVMLRVMYPSKQRNGSWQLVTHPVMVRQAALCERVRQELGSVPKYDWAKAVQPPTTDQVIVLQLTDLKLAELSGKRVLQTSSTSKVRVLSATIPKIAELKQRCVDYCVWKLSSQRVVDASSQPNPEPRSATTTPARPIVSGNEHQPLGGPAMSEGPHITQHLPVGTAASTQQY